MNVKVDVDETHGKVIIRLGLLEKFLALKADFALDIEDIVNAAPLPASMARAGRPGFRSPGTFVPGLVTAGSYGSGSNRQFWWVYRAKQVLDIATRDGEYSHIVLQVPDPIESARQINRLTGDHNGNNVTD